MDHESTRLSADERRILAEIEDGLLGQRRTFLRLFRRSTRPPRRGRARRMWWTVLVVLGSCVLVGGLGVGAVWAAAAGFVAVLVGLHAVTADVTLARGLAVFARLIGLTGDETSQHTG
jgi:hypothetical protein